MNDYFLILSQYYNNIYIYFFYEVLFVSYSDKNVCEYFFYYAKNRNWLQNGPYNKQVWLQSLVILYPNKIFHFEWNMILNFCEW